jgi:hypothetical protein
MRIVVAVDDRSVAVLATGTAVAGAKFAAYLDAR